MHMRMHMHMHMRLRMHMHTHTRTFRGLWEAHARRPAAPVPPRAPAHAYTRAHARAMGADERAEGAAFGEFDPAAWQAPRVDRAQGDGPRKGMCMGTGTGMGTGTITGMGTGMVTRMGMSMGMGVDMSMGMGV